MRRLLKLSPAALLFVFLFIPSAEVRADPLVITGGTVAISGTPFSRSAWRSLSYNVSGSNFSFLGGRGDGDSTHHPDGGCDKCKPGDLVSPNSTILSEGIGIAVINGTRYRAWLYQGDTVMTFTGPSAVFPDPSGASTLTLTTSFSMTGTLVIRDLDGSGFPVVFTAPITGQGTAFLTLQLSGPNGVFGYYLSSVRYEFTQTPEPATLLLLGTGLAGAAAYRRRRGASR